jgi:hypothetical protein
MAGAIITSLPVVILNLHHPAQHRYRYHGGRRQGLTGRYENTFRGDDR